MEASTATFCAAKIPLEIAISPRQQKNSRNWRKNLPQKTRAPDGFDILTNPQVRDRLEPFEFSPAAFTVRFHHALLLQRVIEFLKKRQETLGVHLLRSFGGDNAPGTRGFLLLLHANSGERYNSQRNLGYVHLDRIAQNAPNHPYA